MRLAMLRVQERASFFLVLALIKLSIVKRDGEGPQPIPDELSHERGYEGGIQPPTQVRPNGDVGSQPDTRSIQQQIEQFLCELFFVVFCSFTLGWIFEMPIPPHSSVAIFKHQRMSRW